MFSNQFARVIEAVGAAANMQRTARGGGQELNGDLTWRGVYELARPPITASPHLVHARSIVSFPARDPAAQVSAMTMDYFS